MKFLKLFILCTVIFTMKITVFAQIESRRGATGAVTNNITNQLSSIGWQRDGSSNVFLFALTDFVGIGIANPTEALHMFSTTIANPILLIVSDQDGADGPQIRLVLDNDGGEADGDRIAKIHAFGDDDANIEREFVLQTFISEDVSTATYGGSVEYEVRMNAILRSFIMLDGFNGTANQGEFIINEDSQDIDFRIESDNDANAFFIQGSDGFVGVGTGTPITDFHILSADAFPVFTFEGTNAADNGNQPSIELITNDVSPGSGNIIGNLKFLGNDAGLNETIYVSINGLSENIIGTDEAGALDFGILIDNTLISILRLDGHNGVVGQGEVIFNENSRDFDIRFESDDDVNAFYIQGSDGHVGIGGIPDATKELMLVSPLLTNPNFKIESNQSGAQGGSIEFVLASSTGADFDEPGRIEWYSGNDAGGEELVAEIRGVLRDASAGITAGRLWFLIQHNGGVLSQYLTMSGYNGTANQGEIIFNEDGLDVDHRIESDTDPNAFVMLGSSGNIGIGTASPGAGLTMGDDNLIARDTNAGLTAGTTQTQAGGLALTAEINEVATVANANDTVVLPTAVAGLKVTIINNGANAMRIFPASGNDLGAGNNTQMTTALATTDMITFVAYDATNWRGVRGAYVN